MKRIALISSYDIDCGIASYSKHLVPALRQQGFDVQVFPVPVAILRATTFAKNRKASLWLNNMCGELRSFDVVNLQMEPSLFGFWPPAQLKRISAILGASKASVVTIHSYSPPPMSSFAGMLQRPLDFLLRRLYFYGIERFYRRLSGILRKHSQTSAFIVHTKRERLALELEGFPEERVFDHPLTFYPTGFASEADQENARNNLVENYRLDPSDYLIGIFGFISLYKGIVTAIESLKHLPAHYKLLIFGNVHRTVQDFQRRIDPYLDEVIRTVEELSKIYNRRILFCGTLRDKDFAQAMMGCDSVVLPYMEVGQSASGPASMALQLAQHMALSRTDCFLELKRYAGESFDMFDIGNPIELAHILEAKPYETLRSESVTTYRQTYNLESNAIMYRRAIETVTR